MARYPLSTPPYYDYYNEPYPNVNIPEELRKSEKEKGYTHMVAVPGRVAQAREITQIQSAMKDIVKSIGDSIFKDGNIIEGCQVIVAEDKSYATVTSGKVYLNGMVLPVVDTKIYLRGNYSSSESVEETIGFKLMEDLITESEDETLKDPAQGFDNFNQAGCHRIRSRVSIVLNDPDAAPLTKLINGEITVEKYAPEYDTLTQNLAVRTYEESGSYIVNGLKVRVEKIDNPGSSTESSKVNIVIEEGTAYVRGYRISIPSTRRIPIDRALYSETEKLLNQRYRGTDIRLSVGNYVKDITTVLGERSYTIGNMTQPSPPTSTVNTSQIIPLPSDGVRIVSIKEIPGYTEGVDYNYFEGDGRATIEWLYGGSYPSTSYTINLTYLATLRKGVDYELSVNASNQSIVHWLEGGVTPVSNGEVEIEYELYKARKDIVYMDQYGEISVKLGEYATYMSEEVPQVPIDTITLAQLSHSPGAHASEIKVTNMELTRFTMNDIRKLMNRVRNLEYEQSLFSLQDDAKNKSVTGTRKAIFTDPLTDLSKIHYNYNKLNGVIADPSLPTYDAVLDFLSNICYLPLVAEDHDLIYDTLNSTTNSYKRNITLAKTGEMKVLSQMNATRAFQINPYSQFPQTPEISLDPAGDSWIDIEYMDIVGDPITNSEIVATESRHQSRSQVLGGNFTAYSRDNTSTSTTQIGVKTEDPKVTYENISEIASTYIRQRTIAVDGSKFAGDLDNIRCFFDGIEVPLTPTGSTTAGTISGTVKSNSQGKFTATFEIPEKVHTGIKEVRVESDIVIGGYDNKGIALYPAEGTVQTVKRTTSEVTTIQLKQITTTTTTTYVDPVGQTFVLDQMTMIKGIELYFQSVPTDNTPVVCDIREVVNGNITSTVLASKSLSAAEVRPNISSNSEKATRFIFNDPVLLEANKEYAFVVRSTSPSYNIWIAELGENDIITGERVLSNPYLIGVMMSSSNNSSWSMHQTSDIKFSLLADTYATESTALFSEVTADESFARIYLAADSIIPNGTSVEWSYSTDSGTSFMPIVPYNMKLLNSMKSKLYLKAKLTRKADVSATISPMLAKDIVTTELSHYDTQGYYISTDFPGNTFDTVDIILDTYTPEGTSIEVYASNDNGTTRNLATISGSPAIIDSNWEERTYRVSMGTDSDYCQLFIKMNSTFKYSTPAIRKIRAIMYKA